MSCYLRSPTRGSHAAGCIGADRVVVQGQKFFTKRGEVFGESVYSSGCPCGLFDELFAFFFLSYPFSDVELAEVSSATLELTEARDGAKTYIERRFRMADVISTGGNVLCTSAVPH